MENENLNTNSIYYQKSWSKRILDKILEFDIFSQPINMTYKKQSFYNTYYGIFFSFITLFVCVVIIVDAIVFHKPKNTCQYTSIDDTVQKSYEIDLKNELFMFFAVYDIMKLEYINLEEKDYFKAELEMHSKTITNNFLTSSPIKSDLIEFKLCTAPPNLDINFLNTFKNMKVFCVDSTKMSFDNVNLYMTELHFLLKNKIKDNKIYKIAYADLQLELYSSSYTYDVSSNIFKTGYKKYPIRFSDFAFGPNIYRGDLEKENFIFYDGYFNSRTENSFYSLFNWKYDPTATDTSNDKMMTLKMSLPFQAKVNYYQTYSIINTIGVVSGWLFLISSLFGFLVGKLTRFKLLESLVNECYSLITPRGIKKIEETNKSIKERISSDKSNILELVVEDAHKYLINDQLYLNFFQMISFLFCCDFLKTKRLLKIERTIRKAIDELYKTIDIVNIVKSCQEIRLLKEIIFEPYQKKLFENLIHPIITSETVKCAYDIDYLDREFKSEEDKDMISKASLKDSLIQLQSSDQYNNIEFKLISLLNVSPEFKQLFFKIDEKIENVQKDFYSLIKNPNVTKKEQILKNFEKYVKQITKNLEEYKYINNSLIQETNDIMKNYKTLFEENKILKEVLYGDLILENGGQIIEKVISYHPVILPKEKNNEQMESLRNLRKIKKKRGCLFTIEKIVEFIFYLIDGIFCLNGRIRTLKKEYNLAVQHSFESIQHVIRMSFLSFLVFLYFFIYTLVNNNKNSECRISLLCYGFLSYHNEGNEVTFSFSLSIIFYMLILFVYSLNLLVRYYLTRITSNFLKKQFFYSKVLFASPTIHITTIDDSNIQREFILSSFAAMDKFLLKGRLKEKFLNFLIFSANVLCIFINSYITLVIIQVVKNTAEENYGLKIFILAGILSVTTNVLPAFTMYLTRFHINLLPSTIHAIKFWIPFLCKYISYVFYLSSSFEIFLGTNGNYFNQSFTFNFNPDLFICREDQAAYNLIIFMLFENLLRKFFIFIVAVTFKNKKIPYQVEFSIIDNSCNFLLFSVVTLVFPIQGLITFLVFLLDYHFEFFILTTFKTKPHSYNNDNKYELYNIICLYLNLIVLIVMNVIFQNQNAIMNNIVPEIVKNPLLRDNYPPMCLHQNIEDDFQYIFMKNFSQISLSIYECIQNFVLLPSLFGVFFVLIYSKNTMDKASSNMKILLTTLEDKRPKKLTENFELTKKYNEILKTELEISKKKVLDEDEESIDDKSDFSREKIHVQLKNEGNLDRKIGKIIEEEKDYD